MKIVSVPWTDQKYFLIDFYLFVFQDTGVSIDAKSESDMLLSSLLEEIKSVLS